MALAPIIIIYGPNRKVLPGPINVKDPETPDLTGCYCEEFEHHVYTIPKDYFYTLLYGTDFVRKHEPMVIIKQINRMSVLLVDYLNKGTFLPKVEIRWYQYNEKKSKTEEYFRMTLEQVRLHSIEQILPNVKDQKFEQYNHLEKIQLVYKKITWLYPKGYLIHTDIWDNVFDENDGFVAPIEDFIETPVLDSLKLKFTSGSFIEPKEGFEFNKKATIKFTFDSNRMPDYKENKVFAKLFSVYDGKTEDMCQISEGRLTSENTWVTDFKLTKPNTLSPVEYYVVIENQSALNNNFKSEPISIPSKIKGFVHVCCILFDTDETLKNVSCILKNENDDKEYKGTTNNEGIVSWNKIPLDIYLLHIDYNKKTYISLVRWQKTDKIIHKLKLKLI